MYADDNARRAPAAAWKHAGAAALAGLLVAACGTTSLGSSVGTSVEGEGSNLDFLWMAEHPWAPSFQQSGRVRLYAQYRQGGQIVEQDLGAGRLVAQRQMRFVLPHSLRGVPDGPVCLFLSPGRNQAAVPVRTASAGETARFRHADWDGWVRANSARNNDAQDAETLARVLAEAEQRIASQDKALARYGVRQPADCARMSVPATAVEANPRDVIAPAQQAAASQRICVRRARNMRNQEYMNPAYRVDIHEAVAQFRPETSLADSARRQADARLFLGHWQKWIDQTGADYTPELGSASELLPFAGTVPPAIKNWNTHRQTYPGTPAPQAVVTGLLDGYKGCLEDVAKQLAVRHEAWQKARSSQPERDRLYAERKRAECSTEFAEQERLKARVGELRSELAAARARLGVTETTRASTARKVLNGESCSL
ncbi:MAG: hypothetical protein JNL99_07135 [Zoogloea sp.]|nr:hypothetical protein [Zoogloea sp.]